MSRTSGNLHAHQRQEDALDGLAHVEILHGRRAHDRRRVDRFPALRNAGDVEDRIVVRQRVVAGVVAERPFRAQFAQRDVALQHDLGVGRHFKIAGLALDHLDRTAAQETGDHHLVEIGRQRQDGRVHRRRVGADGDGDVHAFGLAFGHSAPVVLRALLVRLPVHAGSALVVNLHPVHAAVALAGIGVARKDHGQRDERTAVARPAGKHRVIVEREAVAF